MFDIRRTNSLGLIAFMCESSFWLRDFSVKIWFTNVIYKVYKIFKPFSQYYKLYYEFGNHSVSINVHND